MENSVMSQQIIIVTSSVTILYETHLPLLAVQVLLLIFVIGPKHVNLGS